jgi:hypothetical protein
MTWSIMLDLETLGTTSDHAILTIGAVLFDPFEVGKFGEELYMRLDVDEQLERGRKINEDTIAWWGRQSADVRDEAFSDNDRFGINDMIKALNKLCAKTPSGDIWAQGPVFDIAFLEDIYRQYGHPTPWHYWQIKDSRTIFQLFGDPREKNKAGLHNALEDCKSQAEGVQMIYQQAGIKPR